MTLTSPPISPTTPSHRHRRRPPSLSTFEVSQETISPSPNTSGHTHGTSLSRRSSRTSQTSHQPPSPVTPRPMSSRSSRRFSYRERKSSRASNNSISSIGPYETNGLENLADELGQAWDPDETNDSAFLDGLREGDADSIVPGSELQSPMDIHDMFDFGIGMGVQRGLSTQSEMLQPPIQSSPSPKTTRGKERRQGHERQDSAYDGSDYGPESDTEEPSDQLPPIVRKRMRDVESITRMSMNADETLSEDGGVVKRTTHALKDLGTQSNVEYGVTRLMTAYTSMATHRTHTTRDVFTQSHSLIYGGMLDLPEEVIDLLLDEIQSLSETLPFLPQQNPLLSLQILASQTTELSYTLRSLTDLLQESRLAANAAMRKLKSVKDMVEEIRMEEDLVENSMMLIQAGDWDRRCRERQAAKTCREVVDGFAHRWGLDSMGYDKGLAQKKIVAA